MQLRDSDHVASTHRGHGHCLAKGVDVAAMMAELLRSRDGLLWRARAARCISPTQPTACSAPTGSSVPASRSPTAPRPRRRLCRTGAVAVAFMGDGATNSGHAPRGAQHGGDLEAPQSSTWSRTTAGGVHLRTLRSRSLILRCAPARYRDGIVHRGRDGLLRCHRKDGRGWSRGRAPVRGPRPRVQHLPLRRPQPGRSAVVAPAGEAERSEPSLRSARTL